MRLYIKIKEELKKGIIGENILDIKVELMTVSYGN